MVKQPSQTGALSQVKLSKDKLSDTDLTDDLNLNDLNNARTHAQGNSSQTDKQELKKLVDQYSEQAVTSALKIAKQYNATHPLQYAKSILENSYTPNTEIKGPMIPVFNLQGVQR